jgi:hypothetical protein
LSATIFEGVPPEWPARFIERYRKGQICCLVDFELRELGVSENGQYSAVFYASDQR